MSKNSNPHKYTVGANSFCVKCGAENPIEIATKLGYYDPLHDSWDSDVHRRQYTPGSCSVSDEQHRANLVSQFSGKYGRG